MKKILKNKVVQDILTIFRIIYLPFYLMVRRHFKFEVKGPLETVNFLTRDNISISRFGDGEFNIIFKKKSIGFQKYSDGLRNDLLMVARGKKSIIGLPVGLKTTNSFNQKVKSFWWSYTVRNYKQINSLFNKNETYYDTNFTRVATEIRDHDTADLIISKITDLWTDRNVIMVEGMYTRFGVGNGLLNNANSVLRILTPAENAYTKKNEILSKITEIGKEIENPVILLALGPTATILAYLLSDNYQAIDIGHFDLQYEYKKYGNYKNVKISTRYDNEHVGGKNVKEINDNKYLSEIRYIIR